MVEAHLPVEFLVCQSRAAVADRLFCIAGRWIFFDAAIREFVGVSSTSFHLRLVPIWIALGSARSASKMPGLPEESGTSGTGRSGIKDVSVLEWHGADVHGRPYPVACAGNADELVRRTEMALPRHILGVPVCGSGSGSKGQCPSMRLS